MPGLRTWALHLFLVVEKDETPEFHAREVDHILTPLNGDRVA